jgi:hypothetical protein
MVKYWIYYEDGSYELIKCPECKIDNIKHIHEPGQYEGMICNQCATRFNIEESKGKIVKILSEKEIDESPEIISSGSAKGKTEYEERAKRLREENR